MEIEKNVHEVLKSLENQLTCLITRQTIFEPVSISCCEKFFELEALQKWLEKNKHCPNCRRQNPTIKIVPKIFCDLIDALIENNIRLKEDQYEPDLPARYIKTNNLPKLQQYFRDHPDKLNDYFECGRNAFMFFVCNDNLRAMRCLLELGANINAISPKTGLTPLQYAVAFDKKQALQWLIEQGADLNYQCGTNGFPCVEYESLDDAEEEDNEDEQYSPVWRTRKAPSATALHLAVMLNRSQMCQQLIVAECNLYILNAANQTPFELAEALSRDDNLCIDIFNTSEALYLRLTQAMLQSEESAETLFMGIVEEAFDNQTNELLNKSFEYIRKNYADHEKWLSIFHKQQLALICGQLENGRYENVIIAIRIFDWINESIDELHGSALMLFIQRQNFTYVRKLIEHHADINSLNPSGMTPLMLAVSIGHTDITQYLLANGADVSICNSKLTTAIALSKSSAILQCFVTPEVISKLIGEYGRINCRVRETLWDLYSKLSEPRSFLKRAALICNTLNCPELLTEVNTLLHFEAIREHSRTILEIIQLETPAKSGQKRSRFFVSMGSWSEELKTLITQFDEYKAQKTIDINLISNLYSQLIDRCPAEYQEMICAPINPEPIRYKI